MLQQHEENGKSKFIRAHGGGGLRAHFPDASPAPPPKQAPVTKALAPSPFWGLPQRDESKCSP